jgi:hypothetical protein
VDEPEQFILESPIFREAFIAAQQRDPHCLEILRLLKDDLTGRDIGKGVQVKRNYVVLEDGLLTRPMRWRKFGPAKPLAVVPAEYRDCRGQCFRPL